MSTTTPNRALTKQEAADRLAVSTGTVTRLIARGELTAKRIGRRVVVTEAELERYLADS